jgi:RNA polymerase sigma-70 factor (sigma-E family)
MQADVDTVRIEGKLLSELYVRHAPEALRLAYLLTGDRALAEDLVQDAFVRMAGRLLHLRSSQMFAAYLRTTVVNLARSHGRRKAVERRYAQRPVAVQTAAAFDPSDRDELRTALMALPIRQRTAVVLRYFEDLSERQVADVMRCRPSAAKSLIARGVTSLRGSLGERS